MTAVCSAHFQKIKLDIEFITIHKNQKNKILYNVFAKGYTKRTYMYVSVCLCVFVKLLSFQPILTVVEQPTQGHLRVKRSSTHVT